MGDLSYADGNGRWDSYGNLMEALHTSAFGGDNHESPMRARIVSARYPNSHLDVGLPSFLYSSRMAHAYHSQLRGYPDSRTNG